MLFSSPEFVLLFLPASVATFFGLRGLGYPRLAKLSIYGFSLVFYAYWDVRFLPLLVGSTLFNYAVGNLLSASHSRDAPARSLLIVGILANLGLLGFF